MALVVFCCPVTGAGVQSGIVTDGRSLELISSEEITLRCPRCGLHTWRVGQAQL